MPEQTMDQRVSTLEKEIAELKVQVSVRLEVQTNEEIVRSQLVLLKSAQEQCIQRGAYENIAPIAREILELITLEKTLFLR